MADALENEWEFVKKEEGEIETERWVRYEGGKKILYISNDKKDAGYFPSEIMDHNNFLRWVGPIPKKAVEAWPGNQWYVWLNEDKGQWLDEYYPKGGYAKQVFADHALMRVEK